jgi:hypothetical protein
MKKYGIRILLRSCLVKGSRLPSPLKKGELNAFFDKISPNLSLPKRGMNAYVQNDGQQSTLMFDFIITKVRYK